MPVMPCKALHWRQFCGMGRVLAGPPCALRNVAGGLGGRGWLNTCASRRTPHAHRLAAGKGAGWGDGSIPGFTCRQRTGRGCSAPFRLPPQVGAGDDPGQEAQPLPHRLSLLRRVNRRIGNGVGDPPAGPVPVELLFVVSQSSLLGLPASMARRTRTLPSSVEALSPEPEPPIGWFIRASPFTREPPYKT